MYFLKKTGVGGKVELIFCFCFIKFHFGCGAGNNIVYSDDIENGNQTDFGSDWKFVQFTESENGSYNNTSSLGGNPTEYKENIDVYWLGIVKEADLKLAKIYTVLVTVAYVLVFIKGVIGNAIVILVISFKPHMRTVTNLFILNLAVADMFVLICCLPATLLANILKSWILGSFMCSGVTYVQAVSVIASAYSLVAISVDRCKAICQRNISTRGFSKTQAKQIIVFIWLIALLLPLPWFFVFELQEFNGVMYCQDIWMNENTGLVYFLIANLFCCYILPFILITIACLIIWWKVSHRRVPQNDSCPSSSPSCQHVRNIHQITKRGVRRMLVVVAFTFLLCWLPLYVLATFIELSSYFTDTERAILSVVVPLAQWLAYWNSCANPVIYAFYNTNFRKTAKSLMHSFYLKYCCCGHGQDIPENPLTLKVILYSRMKRNTFSTSSYYTQSSNANSIRSYSLRRAISRHSSRKAGMFKQDSVVLNENNKTAIQRQSSCGINIENVTAV